MDALNSAGVEVISPVPPSWYPQAWAWLQEVPDANFDATGPVTYAAFVAELDARTTRGETGWGVLYAGQPVGFTYYLPVTTRLGMFHGLCFTQPVCGKGVARPAVEVVLAQLWARGVEKVSAVFFADNLRVARFFTKLGAVEEGVLKKHTLRAGVPSDMRVMAVFRPEE